MKGAPVHAWAQLYLLGAKGADYVMRFDEYARKVESAQNWVWLVQFLLSAYSRKHIFCKTKFMNLDDIVEDLKKFENKLRWRNYHGGNPMPGGFLRIKGAETPVFRGDKNPDLEAWLRGVRGAVLHEVRRRRSALGSTRQHMNMFPLTSGP